MALAVSPSGDAHKKNGCIGLIASVQWFLWVLLAAVAGLGPWLFGAWEMWWFWPFAGMLAMAVAVAGLLVLLGGVPSSAINPWRVRGLLVLPFLAYAIWSGWQSPVFMDAERAVLLHLSGVTVAVLVAICLNPIQQAWLFKFLFCSLAAMAGYGVVNHLVWESRLVLWMPRYDQYAGRATGCYYCPDHFSGAMELLFCISAGILLDRASRGWFWRSLASVAGVLAVVGVLLSKSRGGGATLVVLCGVILVWGFVQWPPQVRWSWRLVMVSGSLLMLGAALMCYPIYGTRFVTYGGLHLVNSTQAQPVKEQIIYKLQRTCRGRMFAGAWRAWKQSPWQGIGAGMHQHLWPQVAASTDGDRDGCVWPTLVNDEFHSYEVHGDWLQLLEEYGVIGFSLFLAPFFGLVAWLRQRLRQESEAWQWDATRGRFPFSFSAWLALAAMTFHSLGDFNLQMPGTTWILAALLGCGVVAGREQRV
ncbi:MAG TPA: hypothetical protein DCS43_10875 [Verrucomicrobia bacterium]|nr:hypothetical protein [Verrucomicrobiota bacterium]